MHQWLLDIFDVFTERANSSGNEQDTRLDPTILPGWAYARALAFRMVEDASKTKVDFIQLANFGFQLEAKIAKRIIRKVRQL